MKNMMDLLMVLAVSVLVRWLVGLHPHSGQGKPPMYGDYEAQRHWMEVTINLKVSDWYRNTSDNNLLYWGLDYPPLTAYHSWICGKVAHWIKPSFVELKSSRGLESYDHKLFMRSTVLIADILIYVAAMTFFYMARRTTDSIYPARRTTVNLYPAGWTIVDTEDLLLSLLYPGLIIIDYGHFQYNCISLGLVLFAITCLRLKKLYLGSILFCLALNYKQMELYHATPFFFYILGLCWEQKFTRGLKLLTMVALTVISTFAIVWLPFLMNLPSVLDVLTRMFPFNRGLYEDKVANFWCSLSVIVKLKQYFTPSTLVRMCTGMTALTLIPSSCRLFLRPQFRSFCLALMNSSLAFFLFSYQVHEKSILLAALPALLLRSEFPIACSWFLIVSCFSMLPLVIKDNLTGAWIALMGIFLLLLLFRFNLRRDMSSMIKFVFDFSLTGCAVLTIGSLMVNPPARYPDLWPVLVSLYSCGHFCLFFMYFNYWQLKRPELKNI